MSDPSARRPYPEAGFPPDYPYGRPADDPALLAEPGTGRPSGEPPAWPPPPMTGYPPVGQVPPGFVPPGFLPVSTERSAARGKALAVLIVSVLLVIPCFAVWTFPAIVLAAVALNRAEVDPVVSRTLSRVAWIWCAVSVALWVAFLVFAMASAPSHPTT